MDRMIAAGTAKECQGETATFAASAGQAEDAEAAVLNEGPRGVQELTDREPSGGD